MCFSSSGSDSTGKGKSSKTTSCNKVCHGYHLVEGQSGHDMEDYLVAEYKQKKNHTLGLFAIFDGHLGDRVPTYLKENLFNNILDEVYYIYVCFYMCFGLRLIGLRLIDFGCFGD